MMHDLATATQIKQQQEHLLLNFSDKKYHNLLIPPPPPYDSLTLLALPWPQMELRASTLEEIVVEVC